MTVRRDHANLTVRDLDATVQFLQTAFPDFRVRGGGTSPMGARWLHVGNDDGYLALNEASTEPAERWVPYGGKPGLNHIGFEVDDVAAVRARLRAAGYTDTTVPNAHPARTRVYFLDADGNDWEFVQYLTTDPAQRHDYELADSGVTAPA
jgi:catechol 2,3-dioxygenase-like lactoylglutathione lyase family enzyme